MNLGRGPDIGSWARRPAGRTAPWAPGAQDEPHVGPAGAPSLGAPISVILGAVLVRRRPVPTSRIKKGRFMVRLRAIALAAVLVALTATAEAQISVYSGHTATMVVSASQQVDIRVAGGCSSNRVVQVVLAAVMTGFYDNGYGLATATRNGAPVIITAA